MKKGHRTNNGKVIDMEKLALLNQKVVAAGNMPVNAKGDILKDGKIVKNSKARTDQFYSQQKVDTKVVSIKTKDMVPNDLVKQSKDKKAKLPPKERILPNGDIIIEETSQDISGDIDGNHTIKK